MSAVLEAWLERATRRLSKASRAQVRLEIEAHYESACEDAAAAGANAQDAERAAVASLGDPALANRQYRKVLLTSAEAGVLRETRWTLCVGTRPWLLLFPALVFVVGVRSLATGDAYFGSMFVLGAVGLAILFASPLLPIYTPGRGRVFRAFRLLWLAAIVMLSLKGSWYLAAMIVPLVRVEWVLASLRRKIPVADWPKQLYL